MQLEVSLGERVVGLIERLDEGAVQFSFTPQYLSERHRPVLSQFFTDKLRRPVVNERHMPAFFTNLLPEGKLRRLIADAIGARGHEEFRLLARIGEDLPGAVVTRLVGDAGAAPEAAPSREFAGRLRFSLAGVQLKFSMLRGDKGLTLPARGRGGDWILKLPDLELEGVPENEYLVMSWARACDIDVPEFDVFTHADVEGLDARFFPEQSVGFAIRRFDRPLPGTSVHIEDLAQVNGFHPWDKYDDQRELKSRINYETIARQVLTYCGLDDLRALVRRLVFMVLSGNSDAHLKNWSLIYPDGRNARLSPAYDQVATVAYSGLGDDLALPFAGSLAFEDVALDGFRRMGAALRLDPEQVAGWAAEDVVRIMDAWPAQRGRMALDLRYALDQHHARLRGAPGSLLYSVQVASGSV